MWVRSKAEALNRTVSGKAKSQEQHSIDCGESRKVTRKTERKAGILRFSGLASRDLAERTTVDTVVSKPPDTVS